MRTTFHRPFRCLLLLAALLVPCLGAQAQDVKVLPADENAKPVAISAEAADENIVVLDGDTATAGAEPIIYVAADSVVQANQTTISKERWLPDPKKSLWLAVVIPGGGQIYNRKYWKLPIFYGGFLGCAYAINWNNTMYHDYAQAYIDIMDDDDTTKSYESFLPPTYDIEANMERLQTLFKKKKDYYRRYRDLSFFCLLGVYALSILDAYVDAELASFDISRDLSLKVRPAVIGTNHSMANNLIPRDAACGVQCALNF